ncbi:hypothetical protein MVEN_01106000 [Mycena venus]|uniref:Uncharacterized protein n=1 Tax=Mycena venus TaxID=2733690 RepID=A0A8H6Y4S8_9AGAR|nr:hypothetical protein MVEN_01106000 [Mycena venus]
MVVRGVLRVGAARHFVCARKHPTTRIVSVADAGAIFGARHRRGSAPWGDVIATSIFVLAFVDLLGCKLSLFISALGMGGFFIGVLKRSPLLATSTVGTVVSDSSKIAAYLDAMHPDTPRLMHVGTIGLHSTFVDAACTLHPTLEIRAPRISREARPRILVAEDVVNELQGKMVMSKAPSLWTNTRHKLNYEPTPLTTGHSLPPPPIPGNKPTRSAPTGPPRLHILGATWGGIFATPDIQSLVSAMQTLTLDMRSLVHVRSPDPLPNTVKTLSVLYQYANAPRACACYPPWSWTCPPPSGRACTRGTRPDAGGVAEPASVERLRSGVDLVQ